MPFKSKAQMRYLFAKHPDIAKRWAKEYGIPKNLPDKINKRKREKKSSVRFGEIDMSLYKKVVDLIQVASSITEQASSLYKQKQNLDKVANSLVPQIVVQLKQAGMIDEFEKDAAERALRNHSQALQILARVLSRTPAATKGSQSLGRPYTEDRSKTASANGKYSNGFRVTATASDSQADAVFFRHLGIES
jgi:hypothetical protein